MRRQSEALASWWQQLPPDARSDLLGLSPAAQLPSDLTRELRSFGVEVADVALVLRLGERSFAAYPQPPALRDFLAAARIWAAVWAAQPR